jgi:hypothetical protein
LFIDSEYVTCRFFKKVPVFAVLSSSLHIVSTYKTIMSPSRLLDQPIQLRPDDIEDVEEVEDEVSDQGDDDEAQSQDSESAQSDMGSEDEVLQPMPQLLESINKV